MSTPNFISQSLFQLYATNNFLSYPYKIDPNTDDYILDENDEPQIDYDAEPYFDYSYFKECVNYTDTELNSKLVFFDIGFEDGHYQGVQTYIEPKYPNDFDPLDWLKYPQYYDPKQLFKEFGYNTYILKRKILKEIDFINNVLLPRLAYNYGFEKLFVIAQFSNGETIYSKEQ